MSLRHALILGASRGIGRAIATSLAQRGFSNILVGRSKAGLEETAALCAKEVPAHIIAADVTTDLSRIAAEIEKITPRISLLWLGTAGFSETALSLTEPPVIRDLIRSGYESLVELVHLTYPLLAAGHAHIIGACSDWSDFHTGGPSVFGSTKVALAGFLDKLRTEVLRDGIRVTSLKMGNVANLESFGLDEFERQAKETGSRFVALRDVCDAIDFIVSRKTGLVTELTLIPGE